MNNIDFDGVGFGLLLPHGPQSPQARASFMGECDRNIELVKGKFTSIWMSDHFNLGSADVLECWTTLTYLAGRYPDFFFGTAVVCQGYRNPALTAKIAATFQFLTGGRLILGVGAGWNGVEFNSFNYPFPSPGVRISELEEAVQITKLLWTQDETTFEGEHYQVHNARCEPRPDPVPPILLAAQQPRMLQIAARLADWWDVSGSALSRDEYPGVSASMDQILQEVGRDPATLRRSYSGPCVIAATEEEVKQISKLPEGKGIVGTPDQVIEQLGAFTRLGVTHFQLVFVGFPNTAPLELFLAKVLPQVISQ